MTSTVLHLLLCLGALLIPDVRGSTPLNQLNPQDLPLSSQGVCRHIVEDVGWFDCRSPECLDGDYRDWSVWQEQQLICQRNCRSGSSGIACEFGDVYSYAKNGLQIGFRCQCSGRSPGTVCLNRHTVASSIAPKIKGWSALGRVKSACARFCLSFRPGTFNNDHCGESLLVPQPPVNGVLPTLPPTQRNSRRRARKAGNLASWSCVCTGDLTAEDGDGGLEGPEP